MSAIASSTCPSCGVVAVPGARFCANCGALLAARTSEEERKLATIVFADVTGSTDLGEQLDPERLRTILTEYFAVMARVIEQWGGTVEKYIGDAILAIFGVPTAREDDPVRALKAATEMQERLGDLNDGFEARHGVRLAVRIGVNTGEVLVPSGASGGGQFLVSGDPVNVAARLEQTAEPGTIVVGERTWSVAKQVFAFGDPVPLTLKGKRDPVIARKLGYQIEANEPTVRFQAPMVGRDRELGTLLGLLDEAIENEQPRLVALIGPAGIGKSRMLREFIAAATQGHGELRVLRGRCVAAGHGITFWALGEILRSASGISLDEAAETAVDKLRGTARAELEPLGLSQGQVDETVFALATSANLALPGNPLDQLDPKEVGDEMARAWPRFLSGLAAGGPAVVVIEDVHWADDRMVGMLELITARSRGPLLLIATARPEFLETHPRFAASDDLTVVSLRPLTDAQSDRLIGELLGSSGVLAELLADVRQKADGNPFFLEEILQRLIDEGALVKDKDDGRWRATERAQKVRLPDTIHGLLAARIDALPAAEKAVLQQAAVVGRVFWPGALGATADGAQLGELLRSLERKGLIGTRPTSTIEGEPEYIFRHILIRDVAYSGVPKARRARAHAETGRWIERLSGDRPEEFGELLAYHYAAAAAGEDADLAWGDAADEREALRMLALDSLIRAGSAARRRFAVDKAISLHEQALALASGDLESTRAHEALGDDYEALFHMDEAVSNYMAAIEAEKRARNDTEAFGSLAAKLALAARRWGAFKQKAPQEEIRALVDEALARDVPLRMRAELLVGAALIASYRQRSSSREPLMDEDRKTLPHSIALAEEGLAIAESLGDALLLFRASEVLALLYWHAGDVERYRAVIDREGSLIDLVPGRREKVDALVGAASAWTEAGRYEEAIRVAEQAFELAKELSPHERMHASFALMWAASAHGDWDRALEVWPWHVSAAAAEPEINCPNVRGGPVLGATLLVWRGEVERAIGLVPVDDAAATRATLFDRALAARYAAVVGDKEAAGRIADDIAADPERTRYPDGFEAFLDTLLLLGRNDQAAGFSSSARAMSNISVLLDPSADVAEATLAIQKGSYEEAQKLLRKAIRRLDEVGVPFEAAKAREQLAGIVEGADRDALRGDALAAYVRLGAAPFVERIRASLAGGTDTPSTATLTSGRRGQ